MNVTVHPFSAASWRGVCPLPSWILTKFCKTVPGVPTGKRKPIADFMKLGFDGNLSPPYPLITAKCNHVLPFLSPAQISMCCPPKDNACLNSVKFPLDAACRNFPSIRYFLFGEVEFGVKGGAVLILELHSSHALLSAFANSKYKTAEKAISNHFIFYRPATRICIQLIPDSSAAWIWPAGYHQRPGPLSELRTRRGHLRPAPVLPGCRAPWIAVAPGRTAPRIAADQEV